MQIIDHLNRYVSDVNKFIVFYGEILGYELIDKGRKQNGKSYAILKGKEHELFISEKEDFELEKAQNFRHIGYLVEDIDELLKNLKIKGLLPADKEIIDKSFSRQFYIKDPDGFEMDLIQWTDKQAFYKHLKDKNSK